MGAAPMPGACDMTRSSLSRASRSSPEFRPRITALNYTRGGRENGRQDAKEARPAGRGRTPGNLGDAKEKVGADGDADQAEGKAKQGGGELKETWGEAKEKAGDLWEKAKNPVDSDDEPNR